MKGRRTLPQCSHGISDAVDMTYQHTVQDFIRGNKVTIYGYWCKEHDRHGTHRTQEPIRKLDLLKEAES